MVLGIIDSGFMVREDIRTVEACNRGYWPCGRQGNQARKGSEQVLAPRESSQTFLLDSWSLFWIVLCQQDTS